MTKQPRKSLLSEIGAVSVFRSDSLAAGRSTNAVQRLLRHHVVGGRLTQLRRGLYAQTALLGSLDPYAVAACLCTDSIIGYVAAINFHLFPDALLPFLPPR